MLPFIFFEKISNFSFIPGLIAASLIYSVAFVYYVRSLSTGEASLVSPLYNFNILFLAMGAWIVLGESLSLPKIAGLVLLLYGASWLKGEKTVLRSFKMLVQDKSCQYMILASLLIAVGRLVDKTMMSSVPPVSYACILCFLISMWTLLHLLMMDGITAISYVLRKRPLLAISCGAINGYSYLCLLYAMKFFEVSVVEPVSMLSIIVTLLLSKTLLKERLGTRIVAAAIMVAGAWILLLR